MEQEELDVYVFRKYEGRLIVDNNIVGTSRGLLFLTENSFSPRILLIMTESDEMHL